MKYAALLLLLGTCACAAQPDSDAKKRLDDADSGLATLKAFSVSECRRDLRVWLPDGVSYAPGNQPDALPTEELTRRVSELSWCNGRLQDARYTQSTATISGDYSYVLFKRAEAVLEKHGLIVEYLNTRSPQP